MNRDIAIFVNNDLFVYLSVRREHVAQHNHVDVDNSVLVHELQSLALEWEHDERDCAPADDQD